MQMQLGSQAFEVPKEKRPDIHDAVNTFLSQQMGGRVPPDSPAFLTYFTTQARLCPPHPHTSPPLSQIRQLAAVVSSLYL